MAAKLPNTLGFVAEEAVPSDAVNEKGRARESRVRPFFGRSTRQREGQRVLSFAGALCLFNTAATSGFGSMLMSELLMATSIIENHC